MKSKQYVTLGIAVIVLGASFYFSEIKFLSYSHSPKLDYASSAIQEIQTASLTVGERSYSMHVSPNETVLGAMRALEKLGDFVFGGKEYPGMGFFVESINGQKNSNNMYWILYVNGKLSGAGISQATIHPGDTVEWRYERGY